MDKGEFAKVIVGMFSNYGKEPKPAGLELYWLMLEKYTIEEVKKSVVFVMQNSEYLPKPSEIYAAITPYHIIGFPSNQDK
jgi:hypothetical protein